MYATHRVIDSTGQPVGFMIGNEFHTDDTVRINIDSIDNLTVAEDGGIRPEKELPELPYTEAVNRRIYDDLVKRNPFVRDIQQELEEWKHDASHVVLQLEGSRQVGKTTELQKFAYVHYDSVIFVNLADDVYDFMGFIQSACTVADMESYCRRAHLPHYINDRHTVLIIDEIQNSSRAYNAIRRLYGGLECDIIVTGSYLGRILGSREFFLPAGTIEKRYLFPLSFREFCRIYGREKLLDNIDLFGGSDRKDYEALERLYEIYSRIGGYPEVVKEYLRTENGDACYEVVGKLLTTFKEESGNYFGNPRDVEIFDSVYREALKEMCNEKRGTGKGMIETITSLTKSSTDLLVNKNEIANAIIWLRYTGVIGMCDLAVDGDMRNIVSSRRLYFSDCGIAAYLASKSMLDPTALAGILTETFVYNELHRLFKVRYAKRQVMEDEVCFSIYGQYELDFMVAGRDRVVYGIEVKTTDGAPVSLKVFIDRRLVDKGIVAKPSYGGHGESFDTIPIYTVGCRFPYR